jgi:methylated-DNA-[protein]-cysteine S-methyltransferase
MKTIRFYETVIGKIGIEENGEAVTRIMFEKELSDQMEQGAETPLMAEAARQLNEYLEGQRQAFDLPLSPEGTQFQRDVWKALQQIPYGQTCSYRDIAENIENPKACRAVGMANNRNPIPIIIPCHRVIGTNGKLVGYGGGLEIKEYLLQLEKGLKVMK